MCIPTPFKLEESASYDAAAVIPDKIKIPSGFEKQKFLIEIGLLLLSVVYGIVFYLNPKIPVDSRYCPENPQSECFRPDLVAYKVTTLLAMCVMGLMGIFHWHFSPHVGRLGRASPEQRLFSHLPAADRQNVAILCFQVWDFVVSLSIPEQVNPIFLIHHVLATITAYCSLEYQMVPYYSVFYGGCSEFSSIFLIFLDKDRMFPIAQGSLADQWVLVCKAMFFFTFSYYRIFGWIYHSVSLWKDCQSVIASGAVERRRPGKAFFLRLFQGLDLLLGALQCYWYYEILKTLAALLK